MAKIIEYRQIPLGDLVIGKGQVRTRDAHKDIDQLAESINKQGLLQPIVVCKAVQMDKWEILTGQRRFLAHKMLQRDTISAAVLDQPVDEAEAKAISITENLIRRKLTGPELIDGITFLFNKYESAKTVHEVTGIPYDEVRRYVKYPRLIPALKKMVDDGTVDLKVALKAQDGTDLGDGNQKEEDAVKLALEMPSMSNVQQNKLIKERHDNPEITVDDAIERARTGSKITQVVVTLTQHAHSALQLYAKDQDLNQDEAAAGIIEDTLRSLGFLEG